jgi:hypothetical protein
MRDLNGELTILVERVEERALADTVSHDREGNVTKTIEDDDDTEPDLPGVNIVLLQVTVEPADGEIICGCHDPGCSNGVVSTNIGDNGNLRGEANVAEEKSAEQWSEGSLP